MLTYKKLITEGKNRKHDNCEEVGENCGVETAEDERLLRRGVEVFQNHLFSMLVCMLSGLLCLMHIPSVSKSLYNTHKSDTKERAFRRYLRTMIHTTRWFQHDVEDRIKSLHRVRQAHRINRKNGASQFEMVITQWAFIGSAVQFPEKLGMQISQEDKRALCHVMYVVGKKLGIDDDLNLCTSRNVAEISEYCELIFCQH